MPRRKTAKADPLIEQSVDEKDIILVNPASTDIVFVHGGRDYPFYGIEADRDVPETHTHVRESIGRAAQAKYPELYEVKLVAGKFERVE